MKVLLLRGNPRKSGYTQYITDLFVQGLVAGGAEVSDIDLTKKKINHCTGCYRCWLVTPGVCIHHDDMPPLLEEFIDADIVVGVTPLYHYSMSSYLKLFLERTFPTTREGFEMTPRNHMRNRTRYPQRWEGKRFAYIAAGAFRHHDNFSGLEESFRLIAEGMNMTSAGGLIRPETYLLRFALAKPKTIKIIETALVKAGRELVTEGTISEQTRAAVASRLSPDFDNFKIYSTIFWEHASSLGKEGMDLDKILEMVVSDVRILMREMARSVDPVATAKSVFSLQFDFPDKDLHFNLSVNRGTCTIEEKMSDTADLRVIVPARIWAGVFMRTVNVRNALMSKQIELEGDKFLFSRLDRFFPPPVQ